MRKFENIVELGRAALGIDIGASTVETIASGVRKLPGQNRVKLVRKTDNLLRSYSRRAERDRIAGAKLLVALLPESLETIKRFLEKTDDRWWYELHFSLFCFLDSAQSRSARISESVYRKVKDYISSASSNTAQAAWMAGDLLGDHWAGSHVGADLGELALTAQYVAGREAALHGIEHRFRHAGKAERVKLTKILGQLAEEDRSGAVRISARLVMRMVGLAGERTAHA
jgi:hypothetical protein